MKEIVIEIFTGRDAHLYVDYVSNLRIEIFKEYPYLYKGKLEYEEKYMKEYATNRNSMIAIARIGKEIVGVSTGIPLACESEIIADIKKLLISQQRNINNFYYYGEVIVLPSFRGKGIAAKLYAAQDALALSWGYKCVCILTVVREDNHVLKPKDYIFQDKIWERLNFSRSYLTVEYSWPTIQPDNSIMDVKNKLEMWTKNID